MTPRHFVSRAPCHKSALAAVKPISGVLDNCWRSARSPTLMKFVACNPRTSDAGLTLTNEAGPPSRLLCPWAHRLGGRSTVELRCKFPRM